MAVLSILNEANRPNGLPIEKAFTVPTTFPASQLLVVAGTAFSGTADVALEIEVVIDTQIVQTIHFFSNGPNERRTFAPVFIPITLALDTTHTLVLREKNEALTKSNDRDWFSAALIG